MKKNDKWLIITDLDGTLLKHNDNYPNFSFNEKNMIVLKELMNLGHKVAIVTGRPWRDSKTIYDSLGINTIIANFNGSLIHHPNDEGFIPVSSTINREIIIDLLKNKNVKKSFKNMILEFENYTKIVDQNDEEMMKQFYITNYKNIEKHNLNKPLEKNPHSVHIKIDSSKINKWELLTELKRKYGYAVQFRFWTSEQDNFVTMEINQLSTNKSSAMKYIAAHYNIPAYNTIAFGDGINDVEMLSLAGHGVAMKNAKGTVKTYAKDVTDFDNNDAGVGEYLIKFFNLKI